MVARFNKNPSKVYKMLNSIQHKAALAILTREENALIDLEKALVKAYNEDDKLDIEHYGKYVLCQSDFNAGLREMINIINEAESE